MSKCSIFAERSNCKNSLKSGASRVVAINHLSHQLEGFEPFRWRLAEPIRFFIRIVQLYHRKVRAIQFSLGQLAHEQSYRESSLFATVEFVSFRLVANGGRLSIP